MCKKLKETKEEKRKPKETKEEEKKRLYFCLSVEC